MDARLKKFLDQNREAAAIIVEEARVAATRRSEAECRTAALEATSAKGSDRRAAKKSWQSALTRPQAVPGSC